MISFQHSKRSDGKRFIFEVSWGIFIENLTVFFFLFLRALVNIPKQTLIISPWLLFHNMIISQLELGPPVDWLIELPPFCKNMLKITKSNARPGRSVSEEPPLVTLRTSDKLIRVQLSSILYMSFRIVWEEQINRSIARTVIHSAHCFCSRFDLNMHTYRNLQT